MANSDGGFIGFRDYDREASGFSFTIPNVGGVVPLAPTYILFDNLRASLPAITRGLLVSQKVSINDQYASSAAAATDPNANREEKWLVTWEDTSPFLDILNTVQNSNYLKIFNTEIPTADLSLRVNNQAIVWTEGGVNNVAVFDPFVAAFEALGRSPSGGAINVLKIEDVSRNS